MRAFLLTVLLLQDPFFMGPLASIPFGETRLELGSNELRLELEEFDSEDFVELTATDALKNQIAVGLAVIEADTVRNQAGSHDFHREGPALRLKPIRPNQRTLLSILVPSGTAVAVLMEGKPIFTDEQFRKSAFLYEGKSQDMSGYGIARTVGALVVQGKLQGAPVSILGYRFVPASTLKVAAEAKPEFMAAERTELEKLMAGRKEPLQIDFELYVSSLGQVTNVRPARHDLPIAILAKTVQALQKTRFEPVLIGGAPGPFATYWTVTFPTPR